MAYGYRDKEYFKLKIYRKCGYLKNHKELRACKLVETKMEVFQLRELAQVRRNRPCRKIAKSSSSELCCLGPAVTPNFLTHKCGYLGN